MKNAVENGSGVDRKKGKRNAIAALLATGALLLGAENAYGDQAKVAEAQTKLAKIGELLGDYISSKAEAAELDEDIKKIDEKIVARTQKLADFYQKAYKEQHNISLTDEQARALAKKKLGI